jgi:hypothetical protein
LSFITLVLFARSRRTCSSGGISGSSGVTFNKDVLPILQKNCQSCHRPGQIAPMSLLTYDEARPWARAIKTKVESRQMPPWFADPQYGHFANDRSLKQADIDTIVQWADSGAPAGDPKDAPAPIAWPADGWPARPRRATSTPARRTSPASRSHPGCNRAGTYPNHPRSTPSAPRLDLAEPP